LADAQLDVAMAEKPKPARMRVDQASEALAMIKARGP
jgi:hypothetical protein